MQIRKNATAPEPARLCQRHSGGGERCRLRRSRAPPPRRRRVAMTPQDAADLRRISAYLNGIHTMTARFRQHSSGGGAASGSLWLARPGTNAIRVRSAFTDPADRRSVLCLLRRQATGRDVEGRVEIDPGLVSVARAHNL